jgi:hypothetical protein
MDCDKCFFGGLSMALTNSDLLFDKKVMIFYPIVGLTGQVKMLFHNNPSLGLADVSFSPGGVAVRTVNFDDQEEVVIKVYKGIPDLQDIHPQKYTVSGIIAVGNLGLEVFTGGKDEEPITWEEGLTDVLVVLDSQEVMENQVRTIAFYAEPYKTKVRRKILNLFSRPENE